MGFRANGQGLLLVSRCIFFYSIYISLLFGDYSSYHLNVIHILLTLLQIEYPRNPELTQSDISRSEL